MKIEEVMRDPELAKEIGKQIEARSQREKDIKVRNFKILNRYAKKGQILFTGSSLMEQFPVAEIAASRGITKIIYNRGIGGTTTDEFLKEIDTVLLDIAPTKVFLNIGTNDMTDRVYGTAWKEHLLSNYEKILRIAKERIPEAEIYCMAYYPANLHLPDGPAYAKAAFKERTPENIAACSEGVRLLAEKYGCHYIDCNAGLADENGEQKAKFAIDGVHMYADAYELVFDNLQQYL